MIQFDDVKEMERRASVCCGDGLLDMGIGLGLLILGFVMIFGLGGLAGIYIAFLFPAVRLAKKSITVPRMHHLDFMPEAGVELKLDRIKAVAAVSVVVLLAVGVLAFFMSRTIPARISAGLRANAIIIFGSLLAALFMFVGWGTATKRLRAYAAIAMIMLVVGYWSNMDVTWYLFILGGVVLGWGAAVLRRFVRAYPKMADRNGRGFYSSRAPLRH